MPCPALFSPQCADNDIGGFECVDQRERIDSRSVNLLTQEMLDPPEFVQVVVEYLHPGAEPYCRPCRIFRDRTRSDDHDLGRWHASNSSEDHPLTFVHGGKVL